MITGAHTDAQTTRRQNASGTVLMAAKPLRSTQNGITTDRHLETTTTTAAATTTTTITTTNTVSLCMTVT